MLGKITVHRAANGVIMKTAVDQKNGSVVRIVETELTLAHCGDGPDPRLVELVRLLARRAARDWYKHLAEEHRLKRS
jgi:hypothetical protein